MGKGYVCDQCYQVLSTRGHLTRHMKRHTGTKSHECPILGCDYKSARKDNRNVHFDSHKRKLQKQGISYQLKEEVPFIQEEMAKLPTTPESLSSPAVDTNADMPYIYPYPSPNEYYYSYYPQEVYSYQDYSQEYTQDYGYNYNTSLEL